MTAATALAKVRSTPPWMEKIVLAIIVAVSTWGLTTYKMDALRDERINNNSKAIEQKVNKESMEEFKREVLTRLDRIERKLDDKELKK